MFTAFLYLEIQLYFWLLRNCCCILGYVQDIKEVLFSASKEERLQAPEKYTERQPPPLNTQFGERFPKAGAVKQQLQRKMNITQLYPPGIYGLHFFICVKQLKMEEIFLIYYEKIIFNIKTLIVPQRQSKTFCSTQWLLHLRLNHKVQVEKKEHVVNPASP